MKKIFAMAALVLGTSGLANAQAVVNKTMAEVQDTAAVVAHFQSNPKDTLRYTGIVVMSEDGVIDGAPVAAGDTLNITISCYVVGGNTINWDEKFVKKQVVPNPADAKRAAAIDTAVVETRFVGGLNLDPKLRYDVYYGELEGDLPLATDGKPLLRYGRKDGLNLILGAGYQFGKQSGVDFKGGFSYVARRLKGDIVGGGTRNEMVAGSDHAGEAYWSYYTQATLGGQLFRIDRYDTWRVWLETGVRLCFYDTGWQGNIQSKGSSIAPTFGVTVAKRVFAHRYSVAANLSSYMLPKIYTNATRRRDWGVAATVVIGLNIEKGFWHAK